MKLYGIRNKETNAFIMVYNQYVDGQMIYTDLILSTETEKVEEDLFVTMHKDYIERLLKQIQKSQYHNSRCYNNTYDVSMEIVKCRKLLEVVEIADLNVNIWRIKR